MSEVRRLGAYCNECGELAFELVEEVLERHRKGLPLSWPQFELLTLELERLGLCVVLRQDWLK